MEKLAQLKEREKPGTQENEFKSLHPRDDGGGKRLRNKLTAEGWCVRQQSPLGKKEGF